MTARLPGNSAPLGLVSQAESTKGQSPATSCHLNGGYMQATTSITASQPSKSNLSRAGRTLCVLLLAAAAVLSSLGVTTPQAAPSSNHDLSQALGNTSAPTRSQYFAATGKAVKGDFLGTFERYGLERVGYPISDERIENGRTVQYFERVR